MNNKGTLTITGFLISVVLVSLFAANYGLFIGEVTSNYGTTYNTSSFESFNKFEKITNETEILKEQTTSIQEQTGALDLIGSLFSSGYRVLLLAVTSLDIVKDILQEGIGMINFGAASNNYFLAGVLIVTILFVVGIILSVIFKKDV